MVAGGGAEVVIRSGMGALGGFIDAKGDEQARTECAEGEVGTDAGTVQVDCDVERRSDRRRARRSGRRAGSPRRRRGSRAARRAGDGGTALAAGACILIRVEQRREHRTARRAAAGRARGPARGRGRRAGLHRPTASSATPGRGRRGRPRSSAAAGETRPCVPCEPETHVVTDSLPRQQAWLLEHECPLVRHIDRAAELRVEAAEDAQQRALAGAAAAEDGDELARAASTRSTPSSTARSPNCLVTSPATTAGGRRLAPGGRRARLEAVVGQSAAEAGSPLQGAPFEEADERVRREAEDAVDEQARRR